MFIRTLVFLVIIFHGNCLSIFTGQIQLNVEKIYPESRIITLQFDNNGQIIPQNIPENVTLIDINNDNFIDAFIYFNNLLELHYGFPGGFYMKANHFWSYDKLILKLTCGFNKKISKNKLNISFLDGSEAFLMEYNRIFLSESDYDINKNKQKSDLPKKLIINDGFQIIWESSDIGYYLYNVLTGDLDQDNKMEFIFATRPNWWDNLDILHIYENITDNIYEEIFTFQDTIYNFKVMEITDLDSDSNWELAVMSNGGPVGWTLNPEIILFESCGNNSFQRQTIPAFVDLRETHFECARWADSDLNGKPELIVGLDRDNTSTHYTSVEFYENINPNTFDRRHWSLRFPGLPVHGIAVGDLDSDGSGDIYVGMAGSSTAIHRWEYDGYQSFESKWFDPGLCNPIYPEVVDYDRNGLPNLIFLSDYWDYYPGRSAILYMEATGDDDFQILGLDTTSYIHGSLCLWGRNYNEINNEFYLTAPAEIIIEGSQYFDGYSILLKRNPNYVYPFEPIFYSPRVESTAIHHALVNDLDYDKNIELITGKEFYPAKIWIWEDHISGIKTNQKFILSSTYHAYPNPFNNATTISFQLKKAGKIDIILYDLQGHKLSQPVIRKNYPAGNNTLLLNELNSYLSSSGIYFCVIKSMEGNGIIKLFYIK